MTTDEAQRVLEDILLAPAVASITDVQPPSPAVTSSSISQALAPYASKHTIHHMDSAMRDLSASLNKIIPDVLIGETSKILEDVKDANFDSLTPNEKAFYERIVIQQIGITLGADYDGLGNIPIGVPEMPVIGVEKIANALASHDELQGLAEGMRDNGSVYDQLSDIANASPSSNKLDNNHQYDSVFSYGRGRS